VASLLPFASWLRVTAVVTCAASACGLKLDNGAGSGAMDSPAPATARNQAGSGAGGTANALPPEAALSAGKLRDFALQGSAAYDFDDSSFLQCGFTEQWSVSFEGMAFERLQDQALSEECQLSRCLFALSGRGDLSARGRYGQAGTYPRELTISSVSRLERVTRASDLTALNELNCPK
jgi:hypothetical protein